MRQKVVYCNKSQFWSPNCFVISYSIAQHFLSGPILPSPKTVGVGAPSFTPLSARTSGGDDDGVDAWLEPVHHLVEFLLQQQRLDAQPITEHSAVSPHQQLATVMVAKIASLRAAHM